MVLMRYLSFSPPLRWKHIGEIILIGDLSKITLNTLQNSMDKQNIFEVADKIYFFSLSNFEEKIFELEKLTTRNQEMSQ
jgi:hypothetical protein